MERFTRRETLLLTRSNPGRLAYLEKHDIVVPQRPRRDRSGEVTYTWEQILEIRAINRLRRQTSFQAIRKILVFLDEQGIDRSLRTKQFVVTPDSVSWIRPLPSATPEIIQIVGRHNKHAGQMLLTATPPWSWRLEEIWDGTRTSKVIDFQGFRKRFDAPRP